MVDSESLDWTRLWVRLGARWAFRTPTSTAKLLYGFARTEAQSQLELRDAAAACTDVGRRALYLRHALEEARHADAFAERAATLSLAAGSAAFPRPAATSEGLFERFGEVDFLAFVQRGERRGRTQFEVLAGALRRRGDDESASVFESLLADERGHEAYTARLLQELAGPAGSRRALGRAQRMEVWRAFRRRGRRLASAVYTVVMLLLYALLLPYALGVRLLSRAPSGFSSEP